MENVRIIVSGILLSLAIFTGLVPLYLYKKNSVITKYFIGFSSSVFIYSFGYSMELFSPSLKAMLIWNQIQYIGIPFIPAFWILFSLEYTNRKLTINQRLCFFLIPIITFIMRATNGIHHFFYTSVQLKSNQYFTTLFLEKGAWYWVHAIYVTGCFLVSTYVYYKMYQKTEGTIRHQSLVMLLVSLLPWIANSFNLLNISPFQIDYASIAVDVSVVLLFIAFLKYQFLNIKPLARDLYFELTGDGIVVLDHNYHIIDYNKAARDIFNRLNKKVIGEKVQDIFSDYEELLHSILNQEETQWMKEETKRSYKIKAILITEQANRDVGYMVTIADITNYMEMLDALNQLASKDPLTGAFNRRHFVELATIEIDKAKTLKYPLSMMILDLDFFKNVNDSYGHQAGDAVLKKVVQICREGIREEDILGRYGGEEFVIFLPEIQVMECEIMAENIRNKIEHEIINFEKDKIQITTSIGITGVDTVSDETMHYFLKYADKALYLAKEEGRNCIRIIER